MMKKELQKIANTLVLNLYEVESPGLLKGMTGVILFLYHYSRYTNNPMYSDLADKALDNIFNSLTPELSSDLADGAAGIGWGIIHLMNEHFIESDDETLLVDVENKIFDPNVLQTNPLTPYPLFSGGIYLLAAQNSLKKFPHYEKCTAYLLQACQYYFLSITNDIPKPLMLVNSVLYFLLHIRQSFKYQADADRIIYKIFMYLSDKEDYHKEKAGNLRILDKLINSINLFEKEKNNIRNKISQVNTELNWEEYIHYYFWQHFIYFPEEKPDNFSYNLPVEIDKFIMDDLTNDHLSLYNGLAGIGLNLILQEN